MANQYHQEFIIKESKNFFYYELLVSQNSVCDSYGAIKKVWWEETDFGGKQFDRFVITQTDCIEYFGKLLFICQIHYFLPTKPSSYMVLSS